MNYKLLGQSGLRVAELCLGTMTFGEGIKWGADARTSRGTTKPVLTGRSAG